VGILTQQSIAFACGESCILQQLLGAGAIAAKLIELERDVGATKPCQGVPLFQVTGHDRSRRPNGTINTIRRTAMSARQAEIAIDVMWQTGNAIEGGHFRGDAQLALQQPLLHPQSTFAMIERVIHAVETFQDITKGEVAPGNVEMAVRESRFGIK